MDKYIFLDLNILRNSNNNITIDVLDKICEEVNANEGISTKPSMQAYLDDNKIMIIVSHRPETIIGMPKSVDSNEPIIGLAEDYIFDTIQCKDFYDSFSS